MTAMLQLQHDDSYVFDSHFVKKENKIISSSPGEFKSWKQIEWKEFFIM